MKTTQDTKSEKKPLSDRGLRAMKPGDPIRADTGTNIGLRVKCGTAGTKTFFYRYMSPVKQKTVQVKIGNYPDISLSEARVELAKLKRIRKGGECPQALQKQEKERLQEEAKVKQEELASEKFTVRDMVDLYLEEYIEDRRVGDKRIPGARKLKGQKETRRTLYGDPVKYLGSQPASQVTRKDVVKLIDDIVKRGSPVQAGNVHREFKAAYNFSIDLDKFDEDFINPALQASSSIKRAHKNKLVANKRKRVLSDRELVSVLSWLPGSGFSATQKSILMLTLWTGCRTGELCDAEWKDIDLSKSTWHVRDTKNGTSRNVMLCRQAKAYLEQLKWTTNEFVFPSTKTGIPIQQKSLTETKWQLKNPGKVRNGRVYRLEQRWLMDMDDWVPHDLRRTVRTGLAKLKCPSDVAETILGHTLKGVEGIYNHYSYDEECLEWLQLWADYMDQLLEDED